MKLIAHRRNTLAELRATPIEYGVEVDIRSIGERLIIHHDPFVDGEDFIAWLAHYRHGTLILNVKEEGLEQRLLNLMAEQGIGDFFFSTNPSLSLSRPPVKASDAARCACRNSRVSKPY